MVSLRGEYDVAIIGAGGWSGRRRRTALPEGLCTILIERQAPGGQAGTSSRIENYLGFPIGVSGDDLADRALNQALRFGAELIVARRVTTLIPGAPWHSVTLDDGSQVRARAVIIATGVAYRTLNLPGLERLIGAGIYYGAAQSEALGMRGRRLFLVGGGNSAGQAAMFFANYAARSRCCARTSVGQLDVSVPDHPACDAPQHSRRIAQSGGCARGNRSIAGGRHRAVAAAKLPRRCSSVLRGDRVAAAGGDS